MGHHIQVQVMELNTERWIRSHILGDLRGEHRTPSVDRREGCVVSVFKSGQNMRAFNPNHSDMKINNTCLNVMCELISDCCMRYQHLCWEGFWPGHVSSIPPSPQQPPVISDTQHIVLSSTLQTLLCFKILFSSMWRALGKENIGCLYTQKCKFTL